MAHACPIPLGELTCMLTMVLLIWFGYDRLSAAFFPLRFFLLEETEVKDKDEDEDGKE